MLKEIDLCGYETADVGGKRPFSYSTMKPPEQFTIENVRGSVTTDANPTTVIPLVWEGPRFRQVVDEYRADRHHPDLHALFLPALANVSQCLDIPLPDSWFLRYPP